MNCNCKSEYEARLAEVLSEMNPTHRGMKVEIDGYKISISVGEVKTGMTAVIKYESEQQNKSGEWKLKKGKSFVVFKYCPFCGKSTSKEDA